MSILLVFVLRIRRPPRSTRTDTLFPYRRSSDLSSSMIVGEACSGSSTPPMPTPPDRWQLAPICAQEPTVAQVSTMVPRPTYAPMLTYDGIRIAFGAMNEPLRTAAGGTTRAPCSEIGRASWRERVCQYV